MTYSDEGVSLGTDDASATFMSYGWRRCSGPIIIIIIINSQSALRVQIIVCKTLHETRNGKSRGEKNTMFVKFLRGVQSNATLVARSKQRVSTPLLSHSLSLALTASYWVTGIFFSERYNYRFNGLLRFAGRLYIGLVRSVHSFDLLVTIFLRNRRPPPQRHAEPSVSHFLAFRPLRIREFEFPRCRGRHSSSYFGTLPTDRQLVDHWLTGSHVLVFVYPSSTYRPAMQAAHPCSERPVFALCRWVEHCLDVHSYDRRSSADLSLIRQTCNSSAEPISSCNKP